MLNHCLTFSHEESARFRMRVFRARVNALDAIAMHDELQRERVDVAIVRLPARALASISALDRIGCRIIVADTLVHYFKDLRSNAPAAPADSSLRLRPAGAAEATLLGDTARQIFSDYVSHYHANPLFARSAIAEGYAEWAVRHALSNDPCRQAWLIDVDGCTVGFSCVRTSADRSEACGTLNGILPSSRGHGLYGAMLRSMLAHFAADGVRRFTIATQVHNLPVQRVWSNEGFVLDGAENTIHINALLGDYDASKGAR